MEACAESISITTVSALHMVTYSTVHLCSSILCANGQLVLAMAHRSAGKTRTNEYQKPKVDKFNPQNWTAK